MVKSIIKKVKENSKSNKKEVSKKIAEPKLEIKSHKTVEKSKTENKKPKPKELKHDKHAPPKITKIVEPKTAEPKSEISTEQKFEKPSESQSHIENPKPAVEIHSLKQLEEKILEKLEENKPEIKTDIKEILNPEKKDDANISQIKIEDVNVVEIPDNKEADKVDRKKVKKTVDPEISKTKNSEDNDYKSRVEAILFAVGKYLDDELIAQLCDLDKRHVKKALEELKTDYDARDGALMIVQEGNSWKINVREKYLTLVRKVVADTELSKSIMETLAVIAWKTPVYQNEIVRIRGNKCYDHIEELVNTGFVTKDKKGRSYILKTTEKFYNYFDIDQKNLHGVMSEAKMPTEQKTLDEMNKVEETPYSREKLLHALETIETKSIVQTEEDKLSQKQFLENIHKKIDEASKRTDEVVAEIPKPVHEMAQVEQAPENSEIKPAEGTPAPLEGIAITENEDDIIINTDSANGEHHFQKPEEQPQKIKSLTKKQLEKKFKEELQRVKEKTEHKPDK